jgi:hypothetical protein
LWRTMLYKARHCSQRVSLPSHLSSQNHISKPLLVKKEPKSKKNFIYTCD